jgi:hypothetical protein
MSEVQVYLAGEGRNDLGSRAAEPVHQRDTELGVIQALLRSVQPVGWCVIGAITWKQIRKFRACGPTPNEEQNVLGLILEADRAKAEVVAFLRDEDDDRRRHQPVADAMARAAQLYPNLDVIGGVAIPVLEGWILAMRGVHKTEMLSKAGAQRRLADERVETTEQMVQVVGAMRRDRLPEDAETLAKWLDCAAAVLSRRIVAAAS